MLVFPNMIQLSNIKNLITGRRQGLAIPRGLEGEMLLAGRALRKESFRRVPRNLPGPEGERTIIESDPAGFNDAVNLSLSTISLGRLGSNDPPSPEERADLRRAIKTLRNVRQSLR